MNKSYPEEIFDESQVSRKIDAELFIDDRNVGGMLGWGEIYQMLHPEEVGAEAYGQLSQKNSRRKGLFRR